MSKTLKGQPGAIGSPPQNSENSPSPPVPPLPPNPEPPVQLDTLYDLLKIVGFVILWYVTSDANQALSAAVDYSKLVKGAHGLPEASFYGARIGILQGAIMSIQALAIIWASPTLFIYLGPVLTSALRTPIKLVAAFRRALSKKTKDDTDGDI